MGCTQTGFDNKDLYSELINLKDIGFDIDNITKTEIIHNKNESILFRFEYYTKSYIAKYFKNHSDSVEILNYSLLNNLGIPTLTVFGQSDNVIVMEDLRYSSTWRLATKEDINFHETGVAVAEWYLKFHSKGREYVSNAVKVPEFLRREIDEIGEQEIYNTGLKLGLVSNAAWKLAVEKIESLKQAIDLIEETLNYNDFHWTNLALSREGNMGSLTAIVFDYHLMGRGFAYSDCRNVTSSLGPIAKEAFWETYGPYDERERLLDKPTSILYSLYVASKRPEFPKWALSDLEKVRNGQFEKLLHRALDLI